MDKKICNKCGLEKPLNEFDKRKDSKDGYRNRCKKCRIKYQRKYKQENKYKIDEYNKQYYQEHKEENSIRCKQYYQEHKEERKEYDKQYYQEHKEDKREYQINYYYENQEEIIEYKRQYRRDNKEKVAEQSKKYLDSPKGQVAQFNSRNKRRAREENQGNGITKEQWLEMMNFFEWKCAYSGEYIGGKENSKVRTIDHIIPLEKDGENNIWNCVPMIKKYNSSKWIKDMEEWYRQQKYFSEERLNKIYEWIEYSKNKWN